jgi:hypothetical protein
MTATATAPFRERVEQAFAELQRQEEEEATQEALQKLERTRSEAAKLISGVFGPETRPDFGFAIDTSRWPSARFTIDGIPFQVRYHESEFSSGWELCVESRCTRPGCTKQDLPALTEVFDITGVGRVLHSDDAKHGYHLHCADGSGGGDASSTRTIAQIAACAWAANLDKEDGGASETLFALCDDGTLWARETSRGGTKWLRMDAPPVGGAQ